MLFSAPSNCIPSLFCMLRLPDQAAGAQVRNLSGGELQRVALTMALGQPANVYLIDEPSAYLDSEQRIVAAKVGAPPATGIAW